MMRMVLTLVASLLIVPWAQGQVMELRYEGFTVWLDCARRGAIRFEYTATRDARKSPRFPGRRSKGNNTVATAATGAPRQAANWSRASTASNPRRPIAMRSSSAIRPS